MIIDLERVSPRNRKILFHSSHGIPGISNRKILSNGKRPKIPNQNNAPINVKPVEGGRGEAGGGA